MRGFDSDNSTLSRLISELKIKLLQYFSQTTEINGELKLIEDGFPFQSIFLSEAFNFLVASLIGINISNYRKILS